MAAESRDPLSALLLVGRAAPPTLVRHLAATRALLSTLRRSSLFAVADARDAASLSALPVELGGTLRSLGLVAAAHTPRPAYLPPRVRYISILEPADSSQPASSLGRQGQGRSVPSRMRVKEGARLQWHKLLQAWRLMEAHERSVNVSFELVVKLRFDATPLEACGLPTGPTTPLATYHSYRLL
ncbi:MAG: hypothetical protein SGPRY_011668, partial [Prymnesium sp.]